MPSSDSGLVIDPDVDAALAELLIQTQKEPISPRLRELAKQLESALEDARVRQQNKS